MCLEIQSTNVQKILIISIDAESIKKRKKKRTAFFLVKWNKTKTRLEVGFYEEKHSKRKTCKHLTLFLYGQSQYSLYSEPFLTCQLVLVRQLYMGYLPYYHLSFKLPWGIFLIICYNPVWCLSESIYSHFKSLTGMFLQPFIWRHNCFTEMFGLLFQSRVFFLAIFFIQSLWILLIR